MKFSKKIRNKDFSSQKTDQRKSIEQLENDVWNDDDLKTSLIEKCYAYRKIPIQNLQPEQLRLLIGQEIGLPFLLPLAFDLLEDSVLLTCTFYPGDLLAAVLNIRQDYWRKHPVFYKRLLEIIEKGKMEIENDASPTEKNMIMEKINTFLE